MRAKFYFLVSSFYSLFIIYVSLVNLSDVDIVSFESSDKLYHFICYLILSLFWSAFFFERLGVFKSKVKINIMLSIVTFGIIIEVLQLTLTDYRTFDWWDAFANSIGALLGVLAFDFLRKVFKL